MAGVLVIGASGQMARALVEAPAPAGLAVAAAGRPGLDVLDAASLGAGLDRHRPRIVVNCAAYTAVDKAESESDLAFALNAEAAGRLAGLCATRGLPLIHLSSDYVFAGDKHGAHVETDPVAPATVYGASKLAGERAVAAACPQHLILRTAWVHGPHGPNFVRTMLRLAESRDEIAVVDDQTGNPTYAPHLAAAILEIAAGLAGGAEPDWGIYHCAGAGETTWCGLAREVFQASAALGGRTAHVRPIATTDYPTPARRPANSRLDGSRLAAAFGLRLPDWRQGVRACVARIGASARHQIT